MFWMYQQTPLYPIIKLVFWTFSFVNYVMHVKIIKYNMYKKALRRIKLQTLCLITALVYNYMHQEYIFVHTLRYICTIHGKSFEGENFHGEALASLAPIKFNICAFNVCLIVHMALRVSLFEHCVLFLLLAQYGRSCLWGIRMVRGHYVYQQVWTPVTE